MNNNKLLRYAHDENGVKVNICQAGSDEMTIGCRCPFSHCLYFLPGLEVRLSENSQYDWQY